jgi:hypothetical protein
MAFDHLGLCRRKLAGLDIDLDFVHVQRFKAPQLRGLGWIYTLVWRDILRPRGTGQTGHTRQCYHGQHRKNKAHA